MEIITRTIGGVSEKLLSMSNGQIARSLSFGKNWDKLRIGLRMRINGSATIPDTPRFAIGVCSGTTNTFGSASCDHFVGAVSSDASWVYDAGEYYTNVDFRDGIKVGTTLTTGGSIITNLGQIVSAGGSSVCPILVDLTRVDGTTIGVNVGVVIDSSVATTNISLSDFLAIMEVEAVDTAYNVVSIYGNDQFEDGTQRNVTVDEVSNGDLDSLNIYWDRASFQIEIATIALQKFSTS